MDLDQGIELVDLEPRLLLRAVAQQVWQDGLVVSYVGTQWDSDGLTIPVTACSGKMLKEWKAKTLDKIVINRRSQKRRMS